MSSGSGPSALVNDVNIGPNEQQRQALEKAREQLLKVMQKDAKVTERDLSDVLQKQVQCSS